MSILLFAAMQGSETLQEILATLATLADSKPYKPQDVTMLCKGATLDNVSMTVAETGLAQGYVLSLQSR